jgi:hypothetical protein
MAIWRYASRRLYAERMMWDPSGRILRCLAGHFFVAVLRWMEPKAVEISINNAMVLGDLASATRALNPLFLLVMVVRKKGILSLLVAGGRFCCWGASVLLSGALQRRRECRRSSWSKATAPTSHIGYGLFWPALDGFQPPGYHTNSEDL